MDVLRQQLQCSADIGLVRYDWVKCMERTLPDFNNVHRCRDFDAIRAWDIAHELSVLPFDGLVHRGTDVVFDRVPREPQEEV